MKLVLGFVATHSLFSAAGVLLFLSDELQHMAGLHASVCLSLLLLVVVLSVISNVSRRAGVYLLAAACGIGALGWDMLGVSLFFLHVGGALSLWHLLVIYAGSCVLVILWEHHHLRGSEKAWESQVKGGRIDLSSRSFHPDIQVVSGTGKGMSIPVSVGPLVGIVLGRIVGGDLGHLLLGSLVFVGGLFMVSLAWSNGMGIFLRLRREEKTRGVFRVEYGAPSSQP